MNETEMRRAIDRAIDTGNTEEVERLLDMLPDAEDMPTGFASLIISKCKEKNIMKKIKISKIGIAAAVIGLSCVAVAGSALVKHYSLEHGNRYIQVASDEDIDQKELEKIARNANVDTHDIESGNVMVADTIVYNSVAEAEEKMGMKVVMPEIMPNLELDKVEGCILNDRRKDMYIIYGGSETKHFGITLGYEKLEKGETSVTTGDIDEGTLDSYTSAKGYKFDTFIESGEGGSADIYTTHIGDYEYSLVFEGYGKKDMQDIVDSVDLESYR